MVEDVNSEIERLNQRKNELTMKINLTSDFGEKESLNEEVKRIQSQIEVLEKFKKTKT